MLRKSHISRFEWNVSESKVIWFCVVFFFGSVFWIWFMLICGVHWILSCVPFFFSGSAKYQILFGNWFNGAVTEKAMLMIIECWPEWQQTHVKRQHNKWKWKLPLAKTVSENQAKNAFTYPGIRKLLVKISQLSKTTKPTTNQRQILRKKQYANISNIAEDSDSNQSVTHIEFQFTFCWKYQIPDLFGSKHTHTSLNLCISSKVFVRCEHLFVEGLASWAIDAHSDVHDVASVNALIIIHRTKSGERDRERSREIKRDQERSYKSLQNCQTRFTPKKITNEGAKRVNKAEALVQMNTVHTPTNTIEKLVQCVEVTRI